MQVTKGDYVLTRKAGSARFLRGYGSMGYNQDEELLVTSVANQHWLNVKRATGGGNVFRISRDLVYQPARKLGEVPAGSIAADDPRIAWLFEDAMRLADRLGLCSDFDRIADALGVPGRTRTFNIKIPAGDGIEIVAKVEARSKKLAQQLILERLQDAQPRMKELTA